MGISRKTALQIKNGSVICTVSGPDDGKYAGWITADVDKWHPLLNTDSIYDTEAEALAYVNDLVVSIKAMSIEDIFKKS